MPKTPQDSSMWSEYSASRSGGWEGVLFGFSFELFVGSNCFAAVQSDKITHTP